MRARRGRRWKRTLLLLPIFVSLIFVAVAERGHPAISKASGAAIVAALKDPLSLFADRSPGGRGSGALLSTKGAKAGPEERVLSSVRDRDPPLGTSPVLDDPPFAFDPADLGTGGVLPGGGAPPQEPAIGSPSLSPFSPLAALGGPEFIPGGGGGTPPPGSTPPPTTSTPGPPGGPGGIPGVPEPATWAMLILGFFAVGAALRRQARRRIDPICIR
jgi:hypothetical protein